MSELIKAIDAESMKTDLPVFNVGDTVKVKVIAIKDGKQSLSMKALNETDAEDLPEEKIEIPKAEELTTTLGDLFKNIKL